jgi:hypothetical protein
MAVLTTLRGESGARVRSSLGAPTPLKWAAALAAGPPQAIVGLWKFQGLPAMARAVVAHDPDAATNAARLGVGLALLAIFGWMVWRTRDWRIAIAALGVVMLPMIRNHQYTYSKFYILWPVLVALASLKLRPRYVAGAAAVALTLNMLLVTRQIVEGRTRYADVVHAYRSATPTECFFTSDWSAPFGYRWPGSSAALISILWANDTAMSGDYVTPALRDCFCRAGQVWTNTTAAAADEVTRLTEHFSATAASAGDFLLRPGDGESMGAGVAGLFVYSEERKQELCLLAQR